MTYRWPVLKPVFINNMPICVLIKNPNFKVIPARFSPSSTDGTSVGPEVQGVK